jgi:hypothetical protein
MSTLALRANYEVLDALVRLQACGASIRLQLLYIATLLPYDITASDRTNSDIFIITGRKGRSVRSRADILLIDTRLRPDFFLTFCLYVDYSLRLASATSINAMPNHSMCRALLLIYAYKDGPSELLCVFGPLANRLPRVPLP